MAIPAEELKKLKSFVDMVRQQPSLLKQPELAFFKALLVEWGATIPASAPSKVSSPA